MKKQISGLTPKEIETVVAELQQPRFVAKQLTQWLYKKQIFSFDEMTNVSKRVRELLSERYELGRSKPVRRVVSKDGTVKYLFAVTDGHTVESVFIPDGDRATLCVSSQVGCKMGCRFCMTGRQGFEANLTAAEILNQIYSLPEFERLTNIVFMGQGEPFDNTDEVMRALEVLTAEWGLAWSPKRITVSTVGLMKGMQRFIRESRCNLAISLHFAFGRDRADHMPAQKPYPIEDVVEMLRHEDFCRDIDEGLTREGSHQRRLSFEYILFEGLNDKVHHLDKIVKLLRGLDCRVNLIPFHAIPDSPYVGATTERLMHVRNYLTSKGLFATVRASRGQDIAAACGLLNTKKR
ncbi:MAG: 23S rRNA (adenine(2503)-C(2))-methyltransferase RlmN [Bacteroidaceae bacterium]|nr:23S rRNA (adenine(2503)-C(2))-methyltransferase RlmN [Bacteroidaceae bacterium]MBR4783017.1 23S rRNA (adenine(2503)-C(2))-methyltransferase RlmN [Bacteroidaceae bacterium]